MSSKQVQWCLEGSRQAKSGYARRRKSLAKVIASVAGASMAGLASQLSAATQNMPIAVTGWNQDVIAETSNPLTSTTAGYVISGVSGGSPTGTVLTTATGALPANNTPFVSAANSATTFQIPSYTGANDLIMSTKTFSGVTVSNNATMTLVTPGAYTTLEFLDCGTSNSTLISSLYPLTYKVNFADGSSFTGSTVLPITSATGAALAKVGQEARLSSATPNTAANLFETDITLPYFNKAVSSVSFGIPTSSAVFQASILAISGSAVQSTATWAGSTNNTWDTTTPNWSGSSTYSNGQLALFNDTAPSSATQVTVAPGGVTPLAVQFANNTQNYVISGGAIGGSAPLSVTGSGTVTLNNSNSYTGATLVNSGTLTIGSTGAIASPSITVAPGATLNINSGAQLSAANPSVVANGTVNISTPACGPIFSGTGNVNLNGTVLSTNAGASSTTYSYNISGSGSLVLNSIVTLGGTNTFTGGITLDNGGRLTPTSVNSLGSGLLIFNGGGLNTILTQGQTPVSFSNPYTFGPNAVFDNYDGYYHYSPLTLSGAGYLPAGNDDFSDGVTLTLSGQISGPGTLMAGQLALMTVSNPDNTFTGGIYVNGGTLTLSGGNTYTGPTLIDSTSIYSGTLNLNSSGGLGFTSGVAVGDSGGSGLLVINDNSGYAGLAGGVPGGTPTTAMLNAGTITAGDGLTATWAGNIAVNSSTAGGSILAGNGGTLTVSGTISGGSSQPVGFGDTGGVSTVVLSHSNIYQGETQLSAAVVNPGDNFTLKLGVDNAIPAASGVNFLANYTTLELNGHQQQVAYLTGYTGTVTNSGANPAVLTIGNGNTSAGAAYFSGQITGNLSLAMGGTGAQYINGTNTYSGKTTISSGTIVAGNSQALSAGPVILAGGTLSLSNGSGNVGGFTGMQANGVTTISNNTLTLTSFGTNDAGSAFTSKPVMISNAANGFTASFIYYCDPYQTYVDDGMTFTIQNDPRGSSALGDYGSGLGYGANGVTNGIANSAAVEFNINPLSALGGVGTGFATNGNMTGTNDVSPVELNSEPVQVTLAYNGVAQTLTETLVGQNSGGVYTTTYSGVNFAQILGGNTAYVGFTGGESNLGSVQTITNFSFSSNGNSTAPTSIANTITTAPGTRSVLSATVAPGSNQASIGAMTITAGSQLAIESIGTGPLVLTVPSLSISGSTNHWTGQLDLQNNDLIVSTGGSAGLAQITNQIRSGYNAGNWNGSGITSSTAAADSTHLTALGAILNDLGGSSTGTAIYTNFEGAATSDGDVLLKYTYYGDTNLDGVVDGSDYSRIDAGYLSNGSLTGWYNGDFNYDGVVDGSDYTLIDNAFNQQGASLSAQLATATSQISGNTSAVPEPAMMSVLALGVAGLLGRRRREAPASSPIS